MQWLIDIIKAWIQTYFCDDDFDANDDRVCVKDSGIDHDATTNWVADKHIDWTDTNANLDTEGSIFGGTIESGSTLRCENFFTSEKASIGFVGAPDTTLHCQGPHISGTGVFHAQADPLNHGFMSLEAAAGKIPGYIFEIGGNPEFYWMSAANGSYIALYSYTPSAYLVYFESDGDVRFPHVYSHTVGGTNADLYVDDSGYIGLQPSNLDSKENIRDLWNTEWLHELACHLADRKDGSALNVPCLIAEEVASIMPCMVVYKQTPIVEPREDPVTGQMLDTIVGYEQTDQPLSIKHTGFIVPMIREIQHLKTEQNELRAKIYALEARCP